jgi:AAA+ ATPase superfamily predicted ATPase
MDNPFTFGNPIRDPARFYGRQAEVGQIINRALSSARESTSIVGERRIGKTSLLNYLSSDDVAKKFDLTPERFCLVYIDFQGLSDITPLRFWQRIFKKMARSISQQNLVQEIETLLKNESLDIFDLEDLFEVISQQGLTTIFLLDEFEYVTQNPNFKADFFGGLRALAIHQNLALVTATRRELVDLCHSEEIKGSPFFNIFANVVLRPFSQEEVDAMIHGYLDGSGLFFSLQEQEVIANLGGGYPFFVQMAGNYMVESKRKNLAPELLFQEVSENFDQQADPHFSYLWSHCSESEKITLLTLISLSRQKPSSKTQTNLENLASVHNHAHLDVPELLKRGLLLKDTQQQTYKLISPSLERWIMRDIVAVPGDEESQASVDEWIRADGEETAESMRGVLPKFKKKYWPVVSTVLREMSFELAGAAAFQVLVKSLV